MFSNVMFFIYVSAAVVGFAAVCLLWLILKYARHKEYPMRSMIGFVVSNLVIDAIYFVNLFFGVVLQVYSTAAIVRGLDIAAFLLAEMFWVLFMRATVREYDAKVERNDRTAVLVFGVMTIVAAVSYMICPDVFFYVPEGAMRTYMLILQVVVLVVATIYIADGTILGVKKISSMENKVYMIIISLLTAVKGIWNCINTMWLFRGYVGIHEWGEIVDLTPVFLAGINVMVLLYIFRCESSVLYDRGKDKPRGGASGDDEILAAIAEEGQLTKREKEVLGLVYAGMGNDQISETLYISNNTVKHHVYNMYKKVGVSTRFELMKLISSKK